METKTNRAREAAQALKMTFREKVMGYLLAGLGFVAGLAWNEAIKSAIDAFIPAGQESLVAKFVYALAVTLLVVIVTLILVKVTKTSEKGLKKK